MKTPQDVRAIVQALKELYPDGICSLQYQKDYELLFATRLSAQCTDERVNQVTPAPVSYTHLRAHETDSIRITGLLGLTDGTKDPGKVEKQLRACLPPEESNDFCHRLVLHGRAVCRARKPDCPNCVLRPWCDHFQNTQEG